MRLASHQGWGSVSTRELSIVPPNPHHGEPPHKWSTPTRSAFGLPHPHHPSRAKITTRPAFPSRCSLDPVVGRAPEYTATTPTRQNPRSASGSRTRGCRTARRARGGGSRPGKGPRYGMEGTAGADGAPAEGADDAQAHTRQPDKPAGSRKPAITGRPGRTVGATGRRPGKGKRVASRRVVQGSRPRPADWPLFGPGGRAPWAAARAGERGLDRSALEAWHGHGHDLRRHNDRPATPLGGRGPRIPAGDTSLRRRRLAGWETEHTSCSPKEAGTMRGPRRCPKTNPRCQPGTSETAAKTSAGTAADVDQPAAPPPPSHRRHLGIGPVRQPLG